MSKITRKKEISKKAKFKSSCDSSRNISEPLQWKRQKLEDCWQNFLLPPSFHSRATNSLPCSPVWCHYVESKSFGFLIPNSMLGLVRQCMSLVKWCEFKIHRRGLWLENKKWENSSGSLSPTWKLLAPSMHTARSVFFPSIILRKYFQKYWAFHVEHNISIESFIFLICLTLILVREYWIPPEEEKGVGRHFPKIEKI